MSEETTGLELVWRSHQSVFGPDLKVGIQTVMEIGHEVEEELYGQNKMINLFEAGGIQHVFHPALLPEGDLRDKDEIRFVFVPQMNLQNSRFDQLVLSRRDRGRGSETSWAAAARFPNSVSSEKVVFGFSTINSDNDFYLTLALPGKELDEAGKPIFVPVYIKLLKRKSSEFVYIKIYAEKRGDKNNPEDQVFFGVIAEKAREEDVPETLRRAKPANY